jgi:hypothetical protein
MPENATPDESVQLVIPPDTVVDGDNPLPVSITGSVAVGKVDQGAVGTDPWKVDDDATQTAVAAVTAAVASLQTKLTDGSARVGGNVEVVNDVGNPLPVSGTVEVANDSGNPLPVAGQLVVATAEFNRPNDSNPYAAKDAVADSTSAPTVLSFSGMARAVGGSGYVTKARLVTEDAAIAAPPRVRLHLFRVSPAAINDNAAFATLWTNRANRVGVLEFPTLTLEGAGSAMLYSAPLVGLPLPYVCDAADTKLYGLLETVDAFTPAAQKDWFVELTGDLN